MAELLVVTHIKDRRAGRKGARFLQCPYRPEHKGKAGLVVEEAGLDEARPGDLVARVEEDEIPHLDPEGPDILRAGHGLVQPDLHVLVGPEGLRTVSERRGWRPFREAGSPYLPSRRGPDEKILGLEGRPCEAPICRRRSRPLGFISRTTAPRVSAWQDTTRTSPSIRPFMVARRAPLRVLRTERPRAENSLSALSRISRSPPPRRECPQFLQQPEDVLDINGHDPPLSLSAGRHEGPGEMAGHGPPRLELPQLRGLLFADILPVETSPLEAATLPGARWGWGRPLPG